MDNLNVYTYKEQLFFLLTKNVCLGTGFCHVTLSDEYIMISTDELSSAQLCGGCVCIMYETRKNSRVCFFIINQFSCK